MQSKPKGLKKHINNINKPVICQTNQFYSLFISILEYMGMEIFTIYRFLLHLLCINLSKL